MTILCQKERETLFTASENVNLHTTYGHQTKDSSREIGGGERKRERLGGGRKMR